MSKVSYKPQLSDIDRTSRSEASDCLGAGEFKRIFRTMEGNFSYKDETLSSNW